MYSVPYSRTRMIDSWQESRVGSLKTASSALALVAQHHWRILELIYTLSAAARLIVQLALIARAEAPLVACSLRSMFCLACVCCDHCFADKVHYSLHQNEMKAQADRKWQSGSANTAGSQIATVQLVPIIGGI